jgi:ATP-dependent Clp protease protease subunit
VSTPSLSGSWPLRPSGDPLRPGFQLPGGMPGPLRRDELPLARGAVYERDFLFERRIVMAHGYLDSDRATALCGQLMTLDGLGDKPISLHLRLSDAQLEPAFAVADTIDTLACPVHGLAAGEVGGSALAVLAAARRREMTRHALLRLTEPRERFDGSATELALREEAHRRLVDALYARVAEITGRDVDEIRDDARRGRVFTATQALAYGLVHDVAGAVPPGLA